MNNIGLVFAGGGGKGSYQIGVWRAMRELHIDNTITCVSGNSVGALNSALFAQGNLEIAQRAWFDMNPNDVLFLDLKRILFLRPSIITPGAFLRFCSTQGYFSRRGLLHLMNEYVDFDAFKYNYVYACCCDVTNYPPGTRALMSILTYLDGKNFGEAVYFNLYDFPTPTKEKILLASSAIPLVFKPERIEGCVYFDGGLIDNVPVKPLVENHQCSKIYVVYCDKDQHINQSLYPNTEIIEVMPSADMGDLLTGTFDFSDTGVIKRMEIGYKDGMSILS